LTFGLTAQSTISLTVASIPPTATRLVVGVDGGSLTWPSISSQTITPGTPSALLALGILPGGPYRVRVVAHDAASKAQASGAASSINTTPGGNIAATATLSSYAVTVDAATPASAMNGSPLTIVLDLTDAGNALKVGDAQCWIDYGTVSSPLSNRRYGAVSYTSGSQYQCTVQMTAPGSGSTLYYQLGAYLLDFQYERVTPSLTRPAGGTFSLALVPSGGIALNVTSIPATAVRLVILADGGALAKPLLSSVTVAPGTPSTGASINIASGGPYRVRVISHDSAGQVSRSGQTTVASVPGGGSAAASVALADLAAALDASTPALGAPGSVVALKLNFSDTGDVLSVGASTCWADYGETSGALATRRLGDLTATGSAAYRCTVTMTLLNNASEIYYQFGTKLIEFAWESITPAIKWPAAGPLQLSIPLNITVVTIPAGLAMQVDGTFYTAPQIFAWVRGSSHSISVGSPQFATNTRYVFAFWSDSGAQSHSITVPSAAATYTAVFQTEYLLTTAVLPAGAGTILATPSSSDGYYPTGTAVELSAAATAPYRFAAWSGDLSGNAVSQSLSMTAPHTIAAVFTRPGVLDFNSDGHSDIVWRNYASGQNVVWYMNGAVKLGQGTLPSFTNPNYQLAAIGDMNGDGKPDLIWRNYASGRNLVWYMDGASKLGEVELPVVSDLDWQIQSIGDFNGDGKLDLFWRNPISGDNLVWFMNGVTCMATVDVPAVRSKFWNVVGVADFNKDGQTDLLWQNSFNGGLFLWCMNGVTPFNGVSLEAAPGAQWRLSAANDYDGDGNVDLLWRNQNTGENLIWYMDGTTRLSAAAPASLADTRVAVGGSVYAIAMILSFPDFNDDGKPDLLWRNTTSGANFLWYMNGLVAFNGASMPTMTDLNWKLVGLGDFNEDGKPDLVWRKATTGENLVWYMNGAVKLGEAALPSLSGTTWKLVAVADFNRDNKPDLLWRNATTGEDFIWYMDGVVAMNGGSLPTLVSDSWKVAAAADFNGDGKPDLIWHNAATGATFVWCLNGATLYNGAVPPAEPNLNWKLMAAIDFNGDGKPDLLWRNHTTGENKVWLMDGVNRLSEVSLGSVAGANWTLAGGEE
jgi:hypothetical protein